MGIEAALAKIIRLLIDHGAFGSDAAQADTIADELEQGDTS